MLFEFELRQVEDIIPWGTPPNLSLGWFGLSDGFYRLKVGKEYLLNYTFEVMEYYKKQSPGFVQCPKKYTDKSSWVDYQVARLWEDILDMLPIVLEPLPKELSDILKKNQSEIKQWEQNIALWIKDEDTHRKSTAWISQRYLDTAYLNPQAYIRIWSADNSVYIRWDNKENLVNEVSAWTAEDGLYQISVEEFLEELKAFHDRFMVAMEKRVTDVKTWQNNSVYIDLEQLDREQKDRNQWLNYALARPRSSSEIESALNFLHSINFGNPIQV